MSNEQTLVQLWQQAGMDIDETRLRIFRLMSQSEQKAILESIANEISAVAVSV